jgi:hypothetical protein
LSLKIKIVCKQYAIPQCAHSLNASCPYTKYRPEDGSLEPKHVASCVLFDYICVVVHRINYFIVFYKTTEWLLSKLYSDYSQRRRHLGELGVDVNKMFNFISDNRE